MRKGLWAMAASILMVGAAVSLAQEVGEKSKLAAVGKDGKLVYTPYNDRGDTLPDFSHCGYGGGGVRLPDVAVTVTLSPQPGAGEDTPRIQTAVNQVAKMPCDANGFRGAILLKRGEYRLNASVKISVSGIVIRGEGNSETGTVLRGTGKKAYKLIEVRSTPRGETKANTRRKVTDTYVPVGAQTFTLADTSPFKVGDTVLVVRRSNAEWITYIGMDRIVPRASDPTSTKQWKPFDLNFDRVITAIRGNQVTVDAPIACAMDAQWGGGELVAFDDSSRIEKVGIENLYAISDFDHTKKAKERNQEYFSDEDHASYLVQFDNVKNAWARNLSSRHLAHGIASLERGAKWITVQDCSATDPVSIITGGRRYPFNNSGQLNLIQRCHSKGARHAFTIGGGQVCGPNVFLDCRSEQDYATSEPHQRWSVGGLYDNVTADMAFQDRQWMGTGHGWAGANYVVWNGGGSVICQQPPTAQNFVIGFVGKKSKGAFPRADGWCEAFGKIVSPRSLYLKQLEDRKGIDAVRSIGKAATAQP